jgi:opacity protein-like surface antigen
MVGSRLGFCMIAAVASLAAMAARAADYPQPPPPPPPIYIPPPPIEEFSGWYLRGDIGFSNQNVGSLSATNYSNFASVQNIDKSFDAAPFFGVGVGYYFNDWLRFDVTGEYRGKANFHGLDIGHINATDSADDRYTGSKSELTFLLNGYVDLGTWSRLTPFVGAGIGYSRNTISNFGDISACVNSASCAANGGSDAFGDTASKWSFAWALYAGLGYKVTKNVTVEFAYRYIDLGDAQTGNVSSFTGACCAIYSFHHLTSNDFRLGLRFNLEAFAERPRPVQYYTPPPQYYPPPQPQYYPPPPPLRSKG